MTATVTVVVGNPKPQSRTLDVARRVAEVAASAGMDEYDTVDIDLAMVAGELFDWQSTSVRALVDQVTGSQLAVIASPTYKASYTGLLKAFLDWFARDQLAAVTVVPVMVGAAPTTHWQSRSTCARCSSSSVRRCRRVGFYVLESATR